MKKLTASNIAGKKRKKIKHKTHLPNEGVSTFSLQIAFKSVIFLSFLYIFFCILFVLFSFVKKSKVRKKFEASSFFLFLLNFSLDFGLEGGEEGRREEGRG